eukprot:Gregarina_sp_Poly_1__8778@NODE_526_length_7686_cov_239_700617_g417_i0_p1_GENE_NODE_526_length_7686_cov_239_700617_g417_i0NODE_526_length_7686_cov_239_700617_g417_i0_p1_ORF_typecomplete_len631_score87_25HTH_9/PF08221_11/4_1e06HTH_9/PF08221_11/2_6e02HTH_9/PF08221_11/25TFIIE_alpha/PF02002_17/0_0067TFIIE_alpha/PF02002_17/0_19TFIIE_alpha/PF02002_17/80TFIIE_alpha/PF02002_17/9_1e02RNA_pol_Rpc82/PF05645_13/68RNA_pol_Rpc82/PF05645_13/4_4e06RNA_pol_Rpc82/PF05645_13/2_1RNA_pol_Rpc82/PF05645_13/8_9e02HTH_12
MSCESILIQRLIRDSFGTAPSVIGCLLLQKESVALSELLETSKIGWDALRNSLIALIRHGIVELDIKRIPTGKKENDGSESVVCSIQYALNVDMVLSRLRFPKFLLWVEARYGRTGRLVVLQLLKHGSMRMQDIIDETLRDFKELESIISGTETQSIGHNDMNRPRLQELCTQLVVESVLSRVETVEDVMKTSRPKQQTRRVPEAKETRLRGETGPQAPPVAGRAPPVRKTRGSRTKANSLSSSAVSVTDYRTDSKGLLFGKLDESQEREPPKKTRRVSKKITADVDDTELEDNDTVNSAHGLETLTTDVVLRANVNFLNMELYKQTLENFIALRWSNFPLVRMIVRTLLANARRSGSRIQCPPMTFDQCCQGVNENIKKENKTLATKEGGRQLAYYASTKILQSLDGLDKHKDRFVKRVRRDNSETYQVDWEHVSNVLRHRLVTQIITTRFGICAARVYSLTLDSDGGGESAIRAQSGSDTAFNDAAVYQKYSRFWNDSEVSDLALVSPQMARRHLCELADAGFLRAHLADAVGAIPPTAATPATKHCFVYGAREDMGYRTAINLCYQMTLNLLERKAVEVEKLQRVAMKSANLTQAELYEQKLRELAEDSLEASLSAVDQGLMIAREL